MNEILIDSGIGLIIGISQTIVGYPFDTLKIHAQRGLPLTYNRLYAGAKYQFVIASITSTACYLAFDEVYNHTNNSILAGVAAGVTSGIIINPLEIYKLKHQIGLHHSIITPVITTKNSGLKFTISREVIAFTTYFTTYMKLKEYSPDNVMINGGLAGCASWCFSYPFDTIKTHHQTNNGSATLKQLWNQGLLFRGFRICMTRAFIVNAINFYIYETLHKIWFISNSNI
jgi:hypothetical protein